MSEILREIFTPPTPEDFKPYIRENSGLPPLQLARLSIDMLIGEDRVTLHTPTAGDASFMIRYKNREGAVTSLALPGEDLSVVQLQGATQEGYRVNTGLVWVDMFADKLLQIAQHPISNFRRVVMPAHYNIQGFGDAAETAMGRYMDFTRRAGLRFSDEEEAWIRDIKEL